MNKAEEKVLINLQAAIAGLGKDNIYTEECIKEALIELIKIGNEPKPFDWRGKNIQWVRNIGEIDSVHRVECMDSKGILYTRHSAGPYQMFVELDKLQKLEWSSDNATWRKFE